MKKYIASFFGSYVIGLMIDYAFKGRLINGSIVYHKSERDESDKNFFPVAIIPSTLSHVPDESGELIPVSGIEIARDSVHAQWESLFRSAFTDEESPHSAFMGLAFCLIIRVENLEVPHILFGSDELRSIMHAREPSSCELSFVIGVGNLDKDRDAVLFECEQSIPLLPYDDADSSLTIIMPHDPLGEFSRYIDWESETARKLRRLAISQMVRLIRGQLSAPLLWENN